MYCDQEVGQELQRALSVFIAALAMYIIKMYGGFMTAAAALSYANVP